MGEAAERLVEGEELAELGGEGALGVCEGTGGGGDEEPAVGGFVELEDGAAPANLGGVGHDGRLLSLAEGVAVADREESGSEGLEGGLLLVGEVESAGALLEVCQRCEEGGQVGHLAGEVTPKY